MYGILSGRRSGELGLRSTIRHAQSRGQIDRRRRPHARSTNIAPEKRGNTETKMVRANKCAVDIMTEGLIVESGLRVHSSALRLTLSSLSRKKTGVR